jgi:hypothetical protein
MSRVWGYDLDLNDFTLFETEGAWEQQTSEETAKGYLRNHLRAQITREIPVANRAFIQESARTGIGSGFWLLLRGILTPVSFLGTLFKGNDSSANSVEFIEEYVGRRQAKNAYLDLFPLVFAQFRHGLVHTAMPKIFMRADGLLVGWRATFDPTEHLTILHEPKGSEKNAVYVGVCAEVLYRDVLGGLDRYIADFDDTKRGPTLLANFKQGFLTMAKVYVPGDLSGRMTQQQVETCLSRL